MLFRRNVVLQFPCSAEVLSAKLREEAFLSRVRLKPDGDSELVALNPSPWSRDAFLPRLQLRILDAPGGCSLIASFSLRKYVKVPLILLFCLSLLFTFLDCMAIAAGQAEAFLPAFIFPLISVVFFILGALLFRKNVADIVYHLTSLEL